jgi:hypothetical protein
LIEVQLPDSCDGEYNSGCSRIIIQSAATMDLLRTFHIMNLQARVSPTNFYRSLERMTDGQGLVNLPVSSLDNCILLDLIHCCRIA